MRSRHALLMSESSRKCGSPRCCAHVEHSVVPGAPADAVRTCAHALQHLQSPRPTSSWCNDMASCLSTSYASAKNVKSYSPQRQLGPNCFVVMRPASYSAIIVWYYAMASAGM